MLNDGCASLPIDATSRIELYACEGGSSFPMGQVVARTAREVANSPGCFSSGLVRYTALHYDVPDPPENPPIPKTIKVTQK
eukprot:4941159-Amphidinium_carterae.1